MSEDQNSYQHGGQHYKIEYEHWDFVHHCGMDYFMGNATRYIVRTKGNRDLDLKKAVHYLRKRRELGYPKPTGMRGAHFDKFVKQFDGERQNMLRVVANMESHNAAHYIESEFIHDQGSRR